MLYYAIGLWVVGWVVFEVDLDLWWVFGVCLFCFGFVVLCFDDCVLVLVLCVLRFCFLVGGVFVVFFDVWVSGC